MEGSSAHGTSSAYGTVSGSSFNVDEHEEDRHGSYPARVELAELAAPAPPSSDPPPAPHETEALILAEMEEVAQRRHRGGARELHRFLQGDAQAFLTAKGDNLTNIIDQGERKTFAFPRDELSRLFVHLEACRLEASITHFSERQGTADSRAGIMVDFDVLTPQRGVSLDSRQAFRVVSCIFAQLVRSIDFASGVPPDRGEIPKDFRAHAFVTTKPASVPVVGGVAAAGDAPKTRAATDTCEPKDCSGGRGPGGGRAAQGGSGAQSQLYKWGFHVLVPSIKVSRGYKRLLLRALAEDPGVLGVLRDLGAQEPAKCVDQNAASVPVLFLGSCKRGGQPYALSFAFEAVVDVRPSSAGPPAWYVPAIRQLNPDEYSGQRFNLVAELGLIHPANANDVLAAEAPVAATGRGPNRYVPLVDKFEFECWPEVANKARDLEQRSQNGLIPPEELILAEHGISTLAICDPEARLLHSLLDILSPDYYTDRAKWRDVIFALAGSSSSFRPLGEWFSQKCPQKWADGGAACFDEMWEEALGRVRSGSVRRPLTWRSILFWAKESNPRRFTEIMDRSYFTILTRYVYDYGGIIEHYMVAKLLQVMLGNKFIVDVCSGDGAARRGSAYCWYEFVVPGEPQRAGEAWKWRREVEPDSLHIYMSEGFTSVLDQVATHIEEKRQGAQEEAQALYYKKLGAAFCLSRRKLFNDTFKAGVIRQAAFQFRKRGFAADLDNVPDVLGVCDGVLRLGPTCELLSRFHEYPVSRFTRVRVKPFDPADPWTKLILDAIADIIPEPDFREWMLFFAAQSLNGEPKEGIILFWEGAGQNGKTSFLKWIARVLGEYASKLNIQLLSDDHEAAERPNSAFMRLKHLRFGYFEETNKTQTLNVARMKEVVNPGEASGRDLNQKQEVFNITCNLIGASQYSFIIDTTDHGTWRRIRHYTSKIRFLASPDPKNPFEKKDNQKFVRQYPDDPEFQASLLSILIHYYERLQREHHGEIKNVRSPTLERETEAFRIGQDALHRFISSTIVVSPNHHAEYPLTVISSSYTEWYTRNIDKKRHVATEVIKELENSVLGRYIRPSANHVPVLVGCRVLDADHMALAEGEEAIFDNAQRGRKTFAEWQREGLRARSEQRADWWNPPPDAPNAANDPRANRADLAAKAVRKNNVPHAEEEFLSWPDDDALLAGELERAAPRKNCGDSALDVDAALDLLGEILDASSYPAPPPQSKAEATLDDLYGSGGNDA